MSSSPNSAGANESTANASAAIPLPPPPPPMPGTNGAINVPTYKEVKEKTDAVKAKSEASNSMEQSQFANLPDKLMNTMKREKKPFTYTPLSVGDNGKLDLNQIKSPKMKKRLMANMKDGEEEQDENRIESIDSGLQNNRNQNKLDQELSSPIGGNQSAYSSDFNSTSQTKPSLVVPLSVLNENDDYQNTSNQPFAPLRQTSLSYDLNRPLSPDEKLDQLLNEQLNRNLTTKLQPDLNNNYAPSFYADQNNSSSLFNSKPTQYYGNVKPKKINIGQELADERNFNCVPSSLTQLNDFNQTTQNNFNQSPKLWSSTSQNDTTRPQYYSNSPINYDRSQSQQSYQIPIINENKVTSSPISPPIPPQRQQSLNRSNLVHGEKEIPIQLEEPIQSKSFKVLQKLTAGIEEEIEKLKLIDQQNKAAYQPAYQRDPLEDKLPAYYGTLNHIEQPRLRSERRIPIEVEQNSNSQFNFTSTVNPEYHSKNEQNWIYQNYGLPSTVNPHSTSSFWSQPEWVPASKQPQLSTPFRYQGSNIPSRTFRILQMLSGEDDW